MWYSHSTTIDWMCVKMNMKVYNVICVFFLSIMCMFLFASCSSGRNNSGASDIIAIQSVNSVIDSIKNAGSFCLRSDVVVFQFEDKLYSVFDYDCKRGSEIVNNTAICCNGQYIDDYDANEFNITDASLQEDFLNAKICLGQWSLPTLYEGEFVFSSASVADIHYVANDVSCDYLYKPIHVMNLEG